MKPSQIVTIYSDPITRTTPEGRARLIRQHDEDEAPVVIDGKELQRWDVCFLDDPLGTTYPRAILVE